MLGHTCACKRGREKKTERDIGHLEQNNLYMQNEPIARDIEKVLTAQDLYNRFSASSVKSNGSGKTTLKDASIFIHIRDEYWRSILSSFLSEKHEVLSNVNIRNATKNYSSNLVNSLETALIKCAEKDPIAWESRIESFKVPEFLYFKSQRLPSYARGLFFSHNQSSTSISLRGYDKFFDVGETVLNTWSCIEHSTKGPYSVTKKINGFVVLLSQDPYDSDKIIVSSKSALSDHFSTRNVAYSLSSIILEDITKFVCDDSDKKIYFDFTHLDKSEKNDILEQLVSPEKTNVHAVLAKRYILTHLKDQNLSEKDLALAMDGITAAFEIVDDLHDEHIFRSNPSDQGLYLHGLNMNCSEYISLSMDEVSKFGSKYKFRIVDSIMCNDIEDVKRILNNTEKLGYLKKEFIEGFVVRCFKVKADILKERLKGKYKSEISSVESGKLTINDLEAFTENEFDLVHPYFFKAKIMNSYGVYRDIREILFSIIAHILAVNSRNLRSELHNYKITEDDIELMFQPEDSGRHREFIGDIFNHAKFSLSAFFVEWCFLRKETIPWIMNIMSSKKNIDKTQFHKLETVRNRFLQDLGLYEDSKIPQLFSPYITYFNTLGSASAVSKIRSFKDDVLMIMPFGPPGLGKTTLGKILMESSDGFIKAISSDDGRAAFLSKATSSFSPMTKCVYLDSLNHVKKARLGIMKDFYEKYPNGKILFVQFGFFKDTSSHKEFNFVMKRICHRGQEHKTLKYAKPEDKDILIAIEKKIISSDLLSDSNFSAVYNSKLKRDLTMIYRQADKDSFGLEEALYARNDAIESGILDIFKSKNMILPKPNILHLKLYDHETVKNTNLVINAIQDLYKSKSTGDDKTTSLPIFQDDLCMNLVYRSSSTLFNKDKVTYHLNILKENIDQRHIEVGKTMEEIRNRANELMNQNP